MIFTLFTPLALAQETVTDAEIPPLNVQRFQPSFDARHTAWTDDASLGAHKRFFLRPLFHYARQPLIYEYQNGSITRLVNNVLQADFMVGFTYDRFRVGVDLPIYLYADGDGSPSQSGTGDVAVDTKVVLLDEEDAPRVALRGRLGLPTSNLRDVLPLGSPVPTWELAGIIDGELGAFFLTANLGVRGGPAVSLEDVPVDDFFVFRTAGAYRFDDDTSLALEIAGDIPFTKGAGRATPIEAMLDGRTRVAPDLELLAGLGWGLTSGVAAPDYRVLLGFVWSPEPVRDHDDDGIPDEQDACPDRPEDRDQEEDEDGCPEDRGSVVIEVRDPSGATVEGAVLVVDGEESAGPLTLERASGSVTVQARADGYLDGTLDVTIEDADAGRVVVLQLEPVPVGTIQVEVVDADGAPLEGATVHLGEEQVRGATVAIEVPAATKLPLRVTAEGFRPSQKQYVEVEPGAEQTVRVVLEKARAELKGDRIDLRESVYFDLGKSSIQERSYPLLEQVVAILKEHPELKRLRIEGHTDSRGSAASNKRLSQARAEAVKAFLVERGIAEERLEAVGYGEERPLDPAKTEEAYAKNRRVDFFVVERDDHPQE